MLTFLRKIRKSLIESGSIQKYLLYALGEILLVVIGILIALQVNNWNQSNTAQDELNNSYAKLILDLEGDRESFESLDLVIQQFGERAQSIQDLIAQENSIRDIKTIRALHGSGSVYGARLGNYNLDYFNSTYESLINTGLLYKSRSELTSSLVSQYYQEQENVDRLFQNMAESNRFIRDQATMNPYNYIVRTPDSIFTADNGFVQWMNNHLSDQYQSTQNYMSFYVRQQNSKRRHLSNLLHLNAELQEHLKALLDKK